MKKTNVLCWKEHSVINDKSSTILYYTFPEHAYGHDLLSCHNCGEVYAYDVMAPEYLIPLSKKLEETNCIKCGKKLSETAKPFPETYLGEDGKIYKSKRVWSPVDEDGIFEEFWDLYSEKATTSAPF